MYINSILIPGKKKYIGLKNSCVLCVRVDTVNLPYTLSDQNCVQILCHVRFQLKKALVASGGR